MTSEEAHALPPLNLFDANGRFLGKVIPSVIFLNACDLVDEGNGKILQTDFMKPESLEFLHMRAGSYVSYMKK